MEPLFLINGLFPAYYAGDPGFAVSQITAPLAYILDANGWKMYKRNGVSTAVVNVESVSGLPRLESKVNFTAARIPLELVRRVVAWFQAVYAKYHSEAVGYLYYRQADGAWDFMPPAQVVSAGSAKYDRPPKWDGWMVAGTIHSHGNMGAFHSGTDEADEASFDGVHITVGQLGSIPEFSCCVVVQGCRAKFDPSALIDGLAPQDEVPAAWMAAVKLPPPPADLPEAFVARATKLYTSYYSGAIGEEAYKADLAKIQKEAEAVRSPIRSLEEWSPHELGAVGELARASLVGDKEKGGQRGRRTRG